jgi:hypothetical protein
MCNIPNPSDGRATRHLSVTESRTMTLIKLFRGFGGFASLLETIINNAKRENVAVSNFSGQMSVFHQGEDDHYFTGGLPELIIWAWH